MMTQPPATPTLPRLPREVVPADNRDDPEIILNTTTVGTLSWGPPKFPHVMLQSPVTALTWEHPNRHWRPQNMAHTDLIL